MLKLTSSTTRECVLLALLLLALLSLSGTSSNVRESHTLSPQKYDSALQDIQVPSTNSEHWRTHVTWGPHRVPPSTTIISHVPGWTIFDNLFLLNGTVFVVTDDPELIPDRKMIISTGIEIKNGGDAVAARLPTDHEFRVIATGDAQELFGTSADLIDGATWIVNDHPQFITHYYHWSAELFFGFWRAYSSLDPFISSDGSSSLAALRRIWFSHADADHWRDYASMNEWVLRSVFPSVTAEYSGDWQDRAEMGRPIVFDRVILSDRSAAMKGNDFMRTGRFASEPFALPGSVHWWSIVRGAVTKFSGLDQDLDDGSTPVITYISRQEWGRRTLIQEDHEKLVKELYKLRDQYGVEVNVVSMDKLSHAEQLHLAARTTVSTVRYQKMIARRLTHFETLYKKFARRSISTEQIMMGVHGNGLTSLVWMRPTPKSTVIEFFYPDGFARDYEYTARALGMVHYGVWNDKTFTNPEVPPVKYPDGFQGNSIPLDGETVAKLCVEILQLPSSSEN